MFICVFFLPSSQLNLTNYRKASLLKMLKSAKIKVYVNMYHNNPYQE